MARERERERDTQTEMEPLFILQTKQIQYFEEMSFWADGYDGLESKENWTRGPLTTSF